VLIVIAALAAALYFREHLQEFASYGYAAVFVIGLVSSATVILPVPGLAVSSVLGGVFNPWIVGLVAGIGQALGEVSGYLVGYSSQTLVDENPTYRHIQNWMRRHGVLTLFVLSLIPNPLFDLAGIAAGAVRFPMWKFLLSCALGKIVKNMIFALAGYFGITNLLELLR